MINKFTCLTNTPSTSLNYDVNIVQITSGELNNLENKIKFDEMCLSGCPNYKKKWACPPFSPPYNNFSDGLKQIYIFFMQIRMEQFDYIKSDHLKIKAANNILKSKADRYLREMALKYGKYISSGSCRLCKPCKCKLEQPCSNLEKKTYSFEALGIDVGVLVELYFRSKLLWYRRGQLPEYTSIVCGILTNDKYSLEVLRDEYIELDNKMKIKGEKNERKN
jgi:predicted metal-binding protein